MYKLVGSFINDETWEDAFENVGELLCLLRQNHSNGAVSFIVGIKDDKDNLVPISEWVSEHKDEIKKYIEDENGVTDIERYNYILKDLGCVVPK